MTTLLKPSNYTGALEDREIENKVKLDFQERYVSWLKTLCAFANTNGGVMNVGVSDNLVKVGFPLQEVDRIKRSVESICRNHTKPILKCVFETEPVDQNSKNYILKIVVLKRKGVATWLVSNDTSPQLYVRRDGMSEFATIEEQIELVKPSTLFEYDKAETGVEYNGTTFSDLDAVYRSGNNDEAITKKKLISFGLVTQDDFLTVAGLLFMDNSISPNANVTCTIWPSISKGTDDYSDSKKFNGSLIHLFQATLGYIQAIPYYFFGGEKKGVQRVDTGSFSLVSLREAIINALAHRDYTIDGNEVAINCFPDRIEISSPGSMLHAGEDIVRRPIDPNFFPSIRRNQIICGVFEKCKLMENKGSGFEKILMDYEGLGPDYAPLISSSKVSFTITLRNKKYFLNSATTKNELAPTTKLNANMLKGLMFQSRQNIYLSSPKYEEIEKAILLNRNISVGSLASLTGLTRDGVNYNIRKMKDACLIRRENNEYEFVNDRDRPADYLSLDQETLLRSINWCREHFSSTNVGFSRQSSYELKQLLADDMSLYLSNGQFKTIMLLSGFVPKNIEELNWHFNIQDALPTLKK